MSGFITMTQSACRYITVKLPQKSYLCTGSRAKVATIASFLLSVAMFAPKFFGYDITKILDPTFIVDPIGALQGQVASMIGDQIENLKDQVGSTITDQADRAD